MDVDQDPDHDDIGPRQQQAKRSAYVRRATLRRIISFDRF